MISLRVPAADLTGTASVIDGDTIEIHGQSVRLDGIDAPESSQTCTVNGREWRCGQKAAMALADRIGQRTVTCTEKSRDRYGRIVAVCTAGVDDFSGWMARNGWALAFRKYSTAYVPEEDMARNEHAGIWRGEFTPPWEWRARQRASPTPGADGKSCAIKGNVVGGKRVYYRPGDSGYDQTKIDPAKGERWFCSEAEARAAGWRPLYVGEP